MRKEPKLFAVEMIEALLPLSENPEKIHENEKFNKLHESILREMMEQSLHTTKNITSLSDMFPVFPNTYYDLFRLLSNPLSKWGIFEKVHLKNQEVEHLALLEESGLTDEAYELLNAVQSHKEYQSLPVREALIHCRQKQKEGLDYQAAYVFFRTFIIENPLVEGKRSLFNDSVKEKLNYDPILMKLLQKCYEPFNRFEHQYICQSCGWTTYKKGANRYACVKRSCKDAFDALFLPNFELENTSYTMRTTQAVQFSTVIPGRGELELAKKLTKKGCVVEMYPNLEKDGDIKATKDGRVFLIDCKDYANYKELISTLTEKRNEYPQETIIAVPNETVKNTSRYIHLARELAVKNGVAFRIVDFKELERTICV